MSTAMGRVVLAAVLAGVTATGSFAQTTTSQETKAFEVIGVDGNQLVVRLPEGTRQMTVPDDFRFVVNGQPLSVRELKAGMRGMATITTRTTLTPVTVTEVKNGTVVQRGGGTIVVRTDTDVKRFSQVDLEKRGMTIMRDGKPADVADLREGDRLTATIVTTRQPQVLTEREVQATLATAKTAAAAPAPSAPPPPAPPVAANPPAPQPESPAIVATRTLPKTASSSPLVGLAGVVLLATGLGLRARRRRLVP